MRTLSVHSPARRDTCKIDGIDIPLLQLRTPLSFPFLTLARFSLYTLGSLAFIPILCEASPNLISLSFATFVYDRHSTELNADDFNPRVPVFTRPTKLRDLRILLGHREAVDTPSDIKVVSKLLDNCPLLEYFAMPHFHTPYGLPGGRYIPHLAHMSQLRTVDWGRPLLERGGEWKAESVLRMITSLRLINFLYQHPVRCDILVGECGAYHNR